jgi:hypothetical protein
LRRLDEVELAAGEEGYLLILSDKERVRAALGDLIMEWLEADLDIGGIDEDAFRAELTEAFRGLPTLSEGMAQRALSRYFLDSSALVKRYLDERGTSGFWRSRRQKRSI